MVAKPYFEKLVALNLNFIATEFIPLINNQYAQVGANEVLERIQLSVSAFVNGQTDLTSIWNNLPSDPEVLSAVRSLLNDMIQDVDQPQLRQALEVLVEPMLLSLLAVTDTVKPNDEQLKTIWNDFVQSPEFLGFALIALDFILERFVKNEKTRRFISNLLSAFIK